jgi:hypothetical protein
MQEYRAYTMGDDGHINGFRAFSSENDADARVWAEQLIDAHDVELWGGSRFVIRLEAAGKRNPVSHDVIDGRSEN